MKKLFLFLILFSIIPQVQAYTYIQSKVNGYSVRLMKYDIDNKHYKLKVATTPVWVEKPVHEILRENNMISGVNGVFFCPSDYSFCADRPGTTNNERYVQWEKFAVQEHTWDRVVFGWDQEKNPFLFQSFLINHEKETQIQYWVANWPALLHDGKNMLERYYDIGLIDDKMRTSWTRNFICSTEDKKSIYYWLVYWVNIDQLVWVLAELGCYDAINLDAGMSTTFVYNNRHLVWPGRNVIDVIGIERIWLNTERVYKNVEKLIQQVIKHTENRTKNIEKRKEIITRYIDTFNEFRIKTYESVSTSLYEKNIVWEMDYIWYEIQIKNFHTLEVLILINEIVNQLQKYRSTL